MVAVNANQVMLVALVVAEEEVLAMHRAVVLPPATCLLDGLSLGVIVVRKGDIVFSKIIQNGFFSCHNAIQIFAKIHILNENFLLYCQYFTFSMK